MQQSMARVYICVAYNVAACGRGAARRSSLPGCVAAAVDWQARQSCLVWCGGVK